MRGDNNILKLYAAAYDAADAITIILLPWVCAIVQYIVIGGAKDRAVEMGRTWDYDTQV